MHHLIMYSGGAGSWMAAKRVIEKYGLENVTLLFADVIIECDDLYRFLVESVSEIHGRKRIYHSFNLPGLTQMDDRKAELAKLRKDTMASFPHLVWIADGRTPWEVFTKERFIGNSRIDPCSKLLKRELLNKWRKNHFQPSEVVTHFGIDWTESHRLDRVKERHGEWECQAPLCEAPFISKPQIAALLNSEGIKPPRLYKEGFPHNNCGGFCVKAGQAHFELLLRMRPQTYAFHEAEEKRVQAILGTEHTVLRRTVKGQREYMSFAQFRNDLEAKPKCFDQQEWGGCGCAID